MDLSRFEPKSLLDVSFEPFGDGFLFYPKRGSGGVVVTAAERDDYLAAQPLTAMSLHREFAKRPTANMVRSQRHVRRRFNLAEPVAHTYFRLSFAVLLGFAALGASAFWAKLEAALALYLIGRAGEITFARWAERRRSQR